MLSGSGAKILSVMQDPSEWFLRRGAAHPFSGTIHTLNQQCQIVSMMLRFDRIVGLGMVVLALRRLLAKRDNHPGILRPWRITSF